MYIGIHRYSNARYDIDVLILQKPFGLRNIHIKLTHFLFTSMSKIVIFISKADVNPSWHVDLKHGFKHYPDLQSPHSDEWLGMDLFAVFSNCFLGGYPTGL